MTDFTNPLYEHMSTPSDSPGFNRPFPAIKRESEGLEVRRHDDSGPWDGALAICNVVDLSLHDAETTTPLIAFNEGREMFRVGTDGQLRRAPGVSVADAVACFIRLLEQAK